jgi:hypothetical protein
VIDEAHQAEEVASTYMGIEVVNLGTARLIEVLHNRRSGRTVLSGSPLPKADELDKKLVEAADEAREATGRFFRESATCAQRRSEPHADHSLAPSARR